MPCIANTQPDRAAMIDIAEMAETDSEALRCASLTTPVGRIDETEAARHPDLSNLP